MDLTTERAISYLHAGFSVAPIRPDGSKRPDLSAWEHLQSQRVEDLGALSWWELPARRGEPRGIAIIGGPISGGLEILDFDAPDLFDPWATLLDRLAPGLLARLPTVRTPGGGRHVYFRSAAPEGNQRLAERPTTDDKGRPARKTLLETRGTGGYVLAPGSPAACHATGKTYDLLPGPRIEDTPTISPEEREAILRAARTFSEIPERRAPEHRTPAGGARPGDDFNARGSWAELLEPLGWVSLQGDASGRVLWVRPGKDPGAGHSATEGYVTGGDGSRQLYVFSSSAHPFEPRTAYSLFCAYSLIHHKGDFTAATKALASKGYGQLGCGPRKGRWRPPSGVAEDGSLVEEPAAEGDPGHPEISNYEVEWVTGEADCETKPAYYALEAERILAGIFEATDNWPRRIGSQLFADTDGGVHYLPDDHALFGFLYERAAIRWRSGADAEGARFLTRREVYSILQRKADEVSEISEVPLEPAPVGVYCSQRYQGARGADGTALWGLLGFLRPATEVDEALLFAAILTTFWGGRPGGRPLFVVTGREGVGLQSIGKTAAVQLLSSCVGGAFCVDLEGFSRGDSVAKQLLSDQALHRRVALLDNLEGVTHSTELASLLTIPEIDGRPAFGKQRRRANRLTWFATAVTPSLDSDLLSRSFVIYLDEPPEEETDSWEGRFRDFTARNRPAIIGDALEYLRGPKTSLEGRRGRFPEWESQVLACSDRANEVLAERRARVEAIDADSDALTLFLEALEADATRILKREYSPAELAAIWEKATGRKMAAVWIGRRLREYRAKGKLPRGLWLMAERKHGAAWCVDPGALNLTNRGNSSPEGSGFEFFPESED